MICPLEIAERRDACKLVGVRSQAPSWSEYRIGDDGGEPPLDVHGTSAPRDPIREGSTARVEFLQQVVEAKCSLPPCTS